MCLLDLIDKIKITMYIKVNYAKTLRQHNIKTKEYFKIRAILWTLKV